MEILITALIIITAIYIIYRNISKSSKGECNCGSCSASCPKYNKQNTEAPIIIKDNLKKDFKS